MKEIKLMNLVLKNFKGCEEFDLKLDGHDAKAFADNGAYKTTLYDAFLWNLFGKDSNNRADFAIKTLDEKGNEIPNLEHMVEAIFEIDGQALKLKKVYKEKYTRKRGQSTAEFTGHETNHYIDEVPVKKKEYEEKVSSIVDEDIFKLITSPTFFNENLKWQDRRKTLLEICGNIEIEDVLVYNKELKDLPTILQGRAIEDHKKVIAERRKTINKELDMIPVRIDELTNSTPKEIDVSSIEAEVAAVEKQLDEHATQINNIKNGSAIIDKEALAKQLEFELKQIQQELEAEATENGFKIQTKIQEEESNLIILNRKKDDAEHKSKRLKEEMSKVDETIIRLRDDWHKVNERVYEHNHNAESVCPTCKQDLPVEQLEEAERKAVESFNLKKSQELEKIRSDGKTLSDLNEKKKEEIEGLQKEITALDPQIEAKKKAIEKLTTELTALRNEIKDARQNERYVSKVKEQEDIAEEIKTLKENAQQAVSDVEKEVVALRIKRDELNAQVAQQAQIKANKKRVAELETQQKELAAEFENLEKELYLTEQFTKSKVELLEERINSKFKFARFKLFKTNINGGIEEICETTYEGVPFSSGLNNAAKINVGLDIINTLTEHYGIRAPIFVDNAEAVTQLIDTDSQLVSLIVSEQDKQLRIEKKIDEKEEVA